MQSFVVLTDTTETQKINIENWVPSKKIAFER